MGLWGDLADSCLPLLGAAGLGTGLEWTPGVVVAVAVYFCHSF